MHGGFAPPVLKRHGRTCPFNHLATECLEEGLNTSASSSESPPEKQPGKSGTVTPKRCPSSVCKTTIILMVIMVTTIMGVMSMHALTRLHPQLCQLGQRFFRHQNFSMLRCQVQRLRRDGLWLEDGTNQRAGVEHGRLAMPMHDGVDVLVGQCLRGRIERQLAQKIGQSATCPRTHRLVCVIHVHHDHNRAAILGNGYRVTFGDVHHGPEPGLHFAG